jgi:putative DNA primase/helicase
LNCPNGTVDLRTGELRTHNPTDLLTKVTHAKYNPHAKAPMFSAFLTRVLPSAELRRFVQRLVGYALTGETSEQILPFFYGTGANGKSTFLNIILKAVGDYGLQAGQSLLLAKRGDSHPTELSDLFRARFVVSSELEDGKRFAEALIKQITGGDRIRARRMREDLWEFDPTHTVIVAANHKPEVRGTDEGIWRRIKIVPWEVTIPAGERDPQLPKKLEAELEGILAWAVRGAIEWAQDGLSEPRAVTVQTDEYEREMDVLGGFIDEVCVVGPNCTTKADPLYYAFKEWAEKNGEYKMAQKDFAGRLKERGFERKRKTSGYVWEGIGLRFDGDGPDQGTSMYPGGTHRIHSESGLYKPKTRDSEAPMYPDDPKTGLNAQNVLANGGGTGNRVHQGTSVHGSKPLQSHEQLMEALARVDTNEESG